MLREMGYVRCKPTSRESDGVVDVDDITYQLPTNINAPLPGRTVKGLGEGQEPRAPGLSAGAGSVLGLWSRGAEQKGADRALLLAVET